MFSEEAVSIINSIIEFGKYRKGIIRVYFPDGETFQDISAQQAAQMDFKDFLEIAVKLDGKSFVKIDVE